MNKLLSLLLAGACALSIGTFACSSSETSDDDADDDDTTSSSSSGGSKSDGGSSSGGSSSGGSSSGGSSSSSGGSSSGGAVSFTITNFALDPDTGTAGEAGEHTGTFDLAIEGTPGDEIAVVVGQTGGDEEATIEFVGNPTINQDSGSVTLSITPPAAGEYKFVVGFDIDGDTATTDDQFISNEATLTVE